MNTTKKRIGYRLKAMGVTALLLTAMFFNSFAGEMLVNAAQKVVKGQKASQQVNINGKLDFQIYPNPSKGEKINLEIEGIKSASVEITLYNTIGRVIYKTTLEPEGLPQASVSISPINRLSPGLYFLSISSLNEKLAKKLIVQD